MKRMNNNGFTLVELLATLVILAIIMGIGGFTITNVIENSKKKDYDLLIENIKSSVELYYQECTYVNDDCNGQITLGYLVTNGYLKGNSKDSEGRQTLVNPNDGEPISECVISYEYINGEMVIKAENPTGSCPKSY